MQPPCIEVSVNLILVSELCCILLAFPASAAHPWYRSQEFRKWQQMMLLPHPVQVSQV